MVTHNIKDVQGAWQWGPIPSEYVSNITEIGQDGLIHHQTSRLADFRWC